MTALTNRCAMAGLPSRDDAEMAHGWTSQPWHADMIAKQTLLAPLCLGVRPGVTTQLDEPAMARGGDSLQRQRRVFHFFRRVPNEVVDGTAGAPHDNAAGRLRAGHFVQFAGLDIDRLFRIGADPEADGFA